jgi:signal transduction histidine kinase
MEELAASSPAAPRVPGAASLVAGAPDPILVTDPEGRIVLINATATALLGTVVGEHLEAAGARLLTAEAGREFIAGMRSVLEHGAPYRATFHVRGASGEPLLTMVTATPLCDGESRAAGAIAVLRNLRDVQADWQAARANLEQRAMTLERIVEERTRELRRASQAKDEFLAVLSHELRTPLTPILTWAQILKREPDPARSRQAAEVIERNVRLQIALVEDLLDLTRLTQGTLRVDRRRHDLRNIVGTALRNLTAAAREKAIGVEWQPPGEPVPVEADAGRLVQALGHILSNAIKFSPEGGDIRVTLGRDAETAVVCIRDHGVGIHPEFLPFIFQMFRQQEPGGRRQYGGLGVGLALARQLIDLHGGGIEVTSAGVGRGTEVTIRLPVGREGGHDRERLRTDGWSTARLDGVRVLLVEDSVDTGNSTRLLLEGLGARVSLARSGAGALEVVAVEAPDVILCDLQMPGLDGFEFLRRFRSDPGRRPIPVIAVSGLARSVDSQRSREAGFDGHVSKPFDLATLLTALRQALRQDRRGKPAA